MSRFSSLSSKFNLFLGRYNNLTLDLGGLFTRMMVEDQLIFNQPSCYLRSLESDSILNIGADALALKDKQPPGTEVVFPFKTGVIFDKKQAVNFLQAIFKKKKIRQPLPLMGRGSVIFALPSAATDLDKDVFHDVFKRVGLNQIRSLTKAEAVFNNFSLRTNDQFKQSNLVILDLGYNLTELGIFVNGAPVKLATLQFGSQAITQMIQALVRQKYNLNVGWQSAEKIKFQFPDLLQPEVETSVQNRTNIRGVDLIDNLVVTKTICFNDFAQDLQAIMFNLISEIKLIFSQVDSSLIVSALENGIYLTGGGSLLNGLDSFIFNQLQTQAYQADDPYLDVVKGLGQKLSLD
ncbi:MAG: rod shape-determining protein [Patescibacteria group bacterium]|nr:rod shape-determining protein [Patescibacteria group bacterium]